jgi:excisionase family DNA binding protein
LVIKLYTTTEVAELLRCHPRTVYRLVESDSIPYLRIGGLVRFDSEAIEQWLNEQSSRAS